LRGRSGDRAGEGVSKVVFEVPLSPSHLAQFPASFESGQHRFGVGMLMGHSARWRLEAVGFGHELR
jgi:hypothetical protein